MGNYDVSRDPCEILGINWQDLDVKPIEEIRLAVSKAARPLIRNLHPDHNPEKANDDKAVREFRDQIIASGARIVCRPDSGDATKLIPELLGILEETFGSTENSKGFRVLNNVGILQGDGIYNEKMTEIYRAVMDAGYAANNLVFGSGGSLLQRVNRDNFAFAQKASSILVPDGEGGYVWRGIAQKPVTDHGKDSKEGRLAIVRNDNGSYETINRDVPHTALDIMQTVYVGKRITRMQTLDEVRELARDFAA